MGKFDRVARAVRAFTRELKLGEPKAVRPAGPYPAIGLALGGGFARGIAHIGVLKVFEQEKIPLACIGGTSVGALLGAAYCSGLSAAELEEIASRVRFKDFARWTLSRYGFASSEPMSRFLHRILRVRTFAELKIPLAVVATDFHSGEPVVFRSGPLIDPVRASCAYPGMFLPVRVNGRLLVDGLLAHAVPSEPLRRMGAQRVIAVYLSANWTGSEGPRHVFEVIGQCFSIAQAKMCDHWMSASDLVLQPDVRGVCYDAFERTHELVRAGEEAARKALPMIRAWLAQPATDTATRPQVSSAPAEPSPA